MTPAAPLPDAGRWAHRGRAWLLYGAFAIVTFLLATGRAVERTDEAWFLWVAHRLAHGDVLYRDVYSVTTPLSHWIAAAALNITGTQVLTIRALSVVCFVVTIEAARRIVARTGVGPRGQALLIAALFATASPAANFVALYSGLAVALAICAWVIVTGPAGHAPRRLWLAGILCGLAFQSKPNIGGLMVLAVLVLVATRDDRRARQDRLRDTLRVVGGCATAIVAVLVVVAASGGLSGYLDDTVLNKGGYLRLGVSYVGELRVAVGQITGRYDVALDGRARATLAFLPLIAVVVVGVALVRARAPRRHAAGALAFTVAGLLALVPRPTVTHIAAAAPLILTGVVLTWRALDARPLAVPGLVRLGGVLTAAAVVVLVAHAFSGIRADHAALPHFAGTPMSAANGKRLRRDLGRLRRASDGSVFIVKTNAGFLYLAGGLTDPTRFDIPERTDFGPHDEADAIREVRARHPRFVCLRHRVERPLSARDGLRPIHLERYIQRHYEAVADFGVCRLYRLPARR